MTIIADGLNVTYDQMISMSDDYLAGYEPDERVKEKYSLG